MPAEMSRNGQRFDTLRAPPLCISGLFFRQFHSFNIGDFDHLTANKNGAVLIKFIVEQTGANRPILEEDPDEPIIHICILLMKRFTYFIHKGTCKSGLFAPLTGPSWKKRPTRKK